MQRNNQKHLTAVASTGKTYSANSRYSKVSKLLLHLRDELHRQNPRLAKPTGNMIEHLVFNCPLDLLEGDDWGKIVYRVLCYLEAQLSPTHECDNFFIRSDMDQPLFPNDELFDQYDAFLFAKSMLHFQKQHLGR